MSAGAPPHLIAPFWDDLNVTSGSVFYYNDGARMIVQWDAVNHYNGGGPYTFQAHLYPNGTIYYYYLSMLGTRQDEATIGIQNEARDTALQVAWNSSYMHNGLAVAFMEAGREREAERHIDATLAADPSFDEARRQANIAGEYLRRHGPFEPHRLPLDEMEYTTMPQVVKKLEVLGEIVGKRGTRSRHHEHRRQSSHHEKASHDHGNDTSTLAGRTANPGSADARATCRVPRSSSENAGSSPLPTTSPTMRAAAAAAAPTPAATYRRLCFTAGVTGISPVDVVSTPGRDRTAMRARSKMASRRRRVSASSGAQASPSGSP